MTKDSLAIHYVEDKQTSNNQDLIMEKDDASKPTYLGTMASALSLQASFADLNKRISIKDAYGAVATAMGFRDWRSMKSDIASRDDHEELSKWSSRGPREPTVDGSVNTKIILGGVFDKKPIREICLDTDKYFDLVDTILERIESYLVLDNAIKAKLYWLLSSILRPLVMLRDKERLPLTFQAVRRLLPLNEYLVFAEEILDSDMKHNYANATMNYGVAGSRFSGNRLSTQVSAEEHADLAEIISDVTMALETESEVRA